MPQASHQRLATSMTIFETPLVNTLMRACSRLMLRLIGWRTEGLTPAELATYPRFVLIAAPHTSNWDFPITIMLCFVLRMDVVWMAKASLFAFPFGPLARWLGGIPIDRSASHNTVQATVERFGRHQRLIVIVAPEGTRGKVTHWKSGFYHMAHGAGVPIGLAFLDYRRKVGGVGRMFATSGQFEHDLPQIQQFYSGVTGRHSDRFHPPA